MDKPTLVLGFCDTFSTVEKFFTDILSPYYEIVRDDNNPQYLIFGDSNFGQEHWKYNPKTVRKIMYTGENVRPNYYTYSHAITFDHVNSPFHFRLPLYILDMWSMWKLDNVADGFNYLTRRKIDFEEEKRLKTDFCSFVVSNGGCQDRNEFFHRLNERKKVDSAGRYENNTGLDLPRDDIKTKLNFLRTRKFNLCFENGSYPGYVTEKIVNAFTANTIPIYYGSPTITRDFNPKSFINVHDFHPEEQNSAWRWAIKYILEVDQDDDLYYSILCENPLHNSVPNDMMYLSDFIYWWRTNVEIR